MAQLYRDRYEPLALAGRGAQGEVWMARDHLHDRLVALKIRNTAMVDRAVLLSEARTLLQMRPHEHLPLVRDDFFADERYVIVMDWIEGRSLEAVRDTAYEQIVSHLADVAAALDHLHSHEPAIVHRDVKPQNVVITRDGRTVLVDFGLAGTSVATYLDGTPVFAAPEIASGAGASPASDIYSLAVTAFVTLAGELPMPGRGMELRTVPGPSRERVRRALEAALSIDPRKRPPTAGALVESLRPVTAPNNLPAELSSFVGRDEAVSELTAAMRTSRLMTLSGPGGSGKTRLALRLADAALTSYTDGVWLAELAGVDDPSLVASRVALAVGVPTTGSDAIDAIVAHLQRGSRLLLLDNCEHVIDACAQLVDALLRACPDLVIIATSREPLRVTGEVVWRMQPLPDDAAAALFAARIPLGVSLDRDDMSLVTEICHRLDGIPLAIELAAAQVGSLEVSEIAAGVETALGVLTGGARTNPRQETMRATIGWSYRLLRPDEQAALSRLSVFAGGSTRAAAQEVCDVTDAVDRLVETSLVTSDGDRFRLLETVRQFAAERLDDDERGRLRSRHAAWVEALVQTSDGSSETAWLDRLAADHDNIEAALGFAVSAAPEIAARIARAGVPYWIRRGYWVGGRRWIERILERENQLDAPLRAELLKRAGDMARVQGELDIARARLEAAVALDRALGEPTTTAASLNSLGLVFHALGDLAAARACLEESIDLSRASGEQIVLARALNNLGMVRETAGEMSAAIALFEETATIMRELGAVELGIILVNLGSMLHVTGDLAGARRYLAEAEELFTANGNEHGRSHTLCALAKLELATDDARSARAHIEECLEIVRSLGDAESHTEALHVLAFVEERDGDPHATRRLHAEALELAQRTGAALAVARALSFIGALDVDEGDFATAARRFGEARAIREAAGAATAVEDHVERAIERARDELGVEAFEREWEAGRRNATARRS